MEVKWKIKRKPGAFASDPYYYEVYCNGIFQIAFSKLKTAKMFIQDYDKTEVK